MQFVCIYVCTYVVSERERESKSTRLRDTKRAHACSRHCIGEEKRKNARENASVSVGERESKRVREGKSERERERVREREKEEGREGERIPYQSAA